MNDRENKSEPIVNERVDNNDADRSNTWLAAFAGNVTSQYGEDGIIEKVLEIIGDKDGWCVEFGSWDGMKCSNTYNLIDKKGYSAVLIEGSRKRFKDLRRTFEHNKKAVLINAYVGLEKENGLESILRKTEIPRDFDLLSIDIDGNDYHVWKAVEEYKPKAVIIEFNPTIPKMVEFVQPADMRLSQGSSLLSLCGLAKSKGYELVCTTKTNAIFVDSRYYKLFGIRDNSASEMMTDESMITHIFCGYDGTVFIRGCGTIPWQGIDYKESRVQQIPGWARRVVGDRNIIRRKAGKIFRRLRRKNII